MTKFKRSVVLTLTFATTLTLGACGKNSRFSYPGGSSTSQDAATTGATNADGKDYTAYTTTANVEAMKAQVSDVDNNRDFGAQILTASVVQAHLQKADPQDLTTSSPSQEPQPFQVQVQMQNVGTPLVFQGQLQEQNGAFYSTLNETSGQRSDLQLTASCDNLQCEHGNFILSDNDNHKAAIIISRENRLIKLRTPDDGTPTPDIDPALTTEYGTGQPVTVTSTQIIPGRSYFELHGSDNTSGAALDIKGDLVDPSGDCPTLQVDDPSKRFGQACLFGNDEEGDLLLRMTPPQSDSPQPMTIAATTTIDAPAPVTTAQAPKEGAGLHGILSKLPSFGKKNPPAQTKVPAPVPPPPAPAAKSTAPTTATTINTVVTTTKTPVTTVSKKSSTSPVYLELTERPNTTIIAGAATGAVVQFCGKGKQAESQGAPVTVPANCPVSLDPNANSMIQKIMADCVCKEVSDDLAKYWSAKGTSTAKLIKFLKLAAGTRTDNLTGTPENFRQMVQVLTTTKYPAVKGSLDGNTYPAIMSFITMVESGFQPNAVSGTGALGYWQFEPDTAKSPIVRLSLDQTGDIVPSTQAFTRYFSYLLNEWQGDFEMALSSYNNGKGSMDMTVNSWKDDPNISTSEKEAYGAFHNFWYLRRYHMIKKDVIKDPKGHPIYLNWDYVPQILAAIFAGVSPQTYGVAGVTGMEMK